MFLGYRIIVTGPKRPQGKPPAKEYFGISVILRRPRFIYRRKTLNTTSDYNSSFNKPPASYIDTSSKLDRLPELIALFDPHEFNPRELLNRFRKRRSCDTSRERRSGALSVESNINKGSETANKE